MQVSTLTARYSIKPSKNHVVISIEEKNGRRSTDEYVGTPLARIKTLDSQGRIRTNRK